MLNRWDIMDVLEERSTNIKFGEVLVTIINKADFNEIARQILNKMKPNSDTPLQLNKHDVGRWLEFEKQKPIIGEKVWIWQKGWDRPLIRVIDEEYMKDVEDMWWCQFVLPTIA